MATPLRLVRADQPAARPGPAGPTALKVTGLVKQFGRVPVLRGIDLRLPSGRITGLVGPNAAGKTTLIKAVLGLVRPDAGRIEVLGQSVAAGVEYRAGLGYMPQKASFPENLTAGEVLKLVRELRGSPATDEELLEQFGLVAELGKPVKALSGGTRQKLSAALAFLFSPSLLILDEPTAGLDPLASGIFKEKVLAAREGGAGVLVASHTLSELEEIADDLVFLLDGKVRFHGSLQGLAQLTGHAQLERAIAALMRGTG